LWVQGSKFRVQGSGFRGSEVQRFRSLLSNLNCESLKFEIRHMKIKPFENIEQSSRFRGEFPSSAKN
jgi:hypothetical protein